MKFDIDIILLWVDGSDPQWIEAKNNALGLGSSQDTIDATSARYRDWNNLHYLLRGIETNMPWVRKVHLVTNGQKPKWLNTKHRKLNWVKHRDYMPREYLPTFNSNSIELNVHRIDGLSEHFILFNDDMFIVKPTQPTDFFSKDGLPKDQAVLFRVPSVSYDDIFGHTLLNNIGVINQNFDKRDVLMRNWFKIFSPKNSILAPLMSATYLPTNHLPGFMINHAPQAFLKSVLEEIWDKEYDILHKTSLSKFRSSTDVTQYLAKEWQMVTGKFQPANLLRESKYFSIFPDQLDTACKTITSKKYRMVCINDVEVGDFEYTRGRINDSLESILPDRSGYELYGRGV